MLYILVTALPPFDGDDDKEIIQNVKKLNYTFDSTYFLNLVPEMKNVSAECKDLIAKMLVPADKRMTIEQIYAHPWMTKKVSDQPLKINFNSMKEFGKSSKVPA